ncbi:hypothetical protein THAOC_31879 [Thalassiosira oceanica]|uniref:BHLH domain-containing protein n=1 Tax=Thalassiosira oceanica TaxID=159749 RepID=K0R8D6_THAOC|nr:hypothetical protein THAOC_31879 [Thalassiosira oceanica]|eukprot:EJK49265.1 hypothetical protein THAOC_31879 [Thalassiosira oceanica]
MAWRLTLSARCVIFGEVSASLSSTGLSTTTRSAIATTSAIAGWGSLEKQAATRSSKEAIARAPKVRMCRKRREEQKKKRTKKNTKKEEAEVKRRERLEDALDRMKVKVENMKDDDRSLKFLSNLNSVPACKLVYCCKCRPESCGQGRVSWARIVGLCFPGSKRRIHTAPSIGYTVSRHSPSTVNIMSQYPRPAATHSDEYPSESAGTCRGDGNSNVASEADRLIFRSTSSSSRKNLVDCPNRIKAEVHCAHRR